MTLTDIAVNLASPQFDKDRVALLERAQDAGVRRIVAVGTSLGASREVVKLAQASGGCVRATVGVHPHYAKEWGPQVERELTALLSEEGVCAVGECGLDYFRMLSPQEAQLHAFEAQINMALRSGLPLYLHCRAAFADFTRMLKAHAAGHGVVHCFTGTADEATQLLDLGFDLGVTGWLCDAVRGRSLAAALRHVPLERLHLETDAPYLYPPLPGETKSGKNRRIRNEPAYLTRVASAVAELYKVPYEKVVETCGQRSEALFGFRGT